MSFICQLCGELQGNRKKPVKKVIKTRIKIYPVRKKGKDIIDKGGVGVEVVKEIEVCETCA